MKFSKWGQIDLWNAARYTYCFPAVLSATLLQAVSHLLFRHSIHQRANRLKLSGVN